MLAALLGIVCMLMPQLTVSMVQAGFVMRMEGGHLPAALQDSLPDYTLAFEEAGGDQGPAFFYTCRRTGQLNEEYGDLLAIIHDFEVRCGAVCLICRGSMRVSPQRCPAWPCTCLVTTTLLHWMLGSSC